MPEYLKKKKVKSLPGFSQVLENCVQQLRVLLSLVPRPHTPPLFHGGVWPGDEARSYFITLALGRGTTVCTEFHCIAIIFTILCW